jgi:hypothetical protein
MPVATHAGLNDGSKAAALFKRWRRDEHNAANPVRWMCTQPDGDVFVSHEALPLKPDTI